MQVYGLVGQTEEGIWPEAQLRAIFLPRYDQPVRKLAYCPKAHVLFVILYRIFKYTLYPFVAVIFTLICF